MPIMASAQIRRQVEREEGENVRHELDQAFDSIRSLLAGSQDVAMNLTDGPATAVPSSEKYDVEYDQHVRELVFDQRAKPKDRLKTEEELALEEKEKLEKAERQRLRRMQGLPEEDSDDDTRPSKRRERGGDDLDDDFADGGVDWAGLGGMGTLKTDDDDEHDAESAENEESDEDESDEDEGFSEEELEFSDEEQSSEVEGEHENVAPSSRKVPRQDKTELPFTFPCPSTHDELLEIIEDVDEKNIPIVVQRVRALHHTSFAPENKFKLQVCLICYPIIVTLPFQRGSRVS
jgi:nucleolar protein 14